jgi:phytoene/squalene synthetase
MTNWNQLLERTNHTLALSVGFLDEPLRKSVTHGLLALRMVDTIEDLHPSPIERRRALLGFSEFVRKPSRQLADSLLRSLSRGDRVPSTTAQRAAAPLVLSLPDLVDAVDELPVDEARAIWSHAARAAELTSAFAMRARSHGEVVLRNADELEVYCQARTGVAAELVTDLLVRHEPMLVPIADTLRSIAGDSAKGVTLVDYLDDEGVDSSYSICVLEPLDRVTIMAISKDGILQAQRYARMMRDAGARRSLVAFVSLPIAWAKCRLDRIWFQQEADASEPRRLECVH